MLEGVIVGKSDPSADMIRVLINHVMDSVDTCWILPTTQPNFPTQIRVCRHGSHCRLQISTGSDTSVGKT